MYFQEHHLEKSPELHSLQLITKTAFCKNEPPCAGVAAERPTVADDGYPEQFLVWMCVAV